MPLKTFFSILFISLFILSPFEIHPSIIIDDYMTKKEKEEIGIDSLSYQQFLKLEQWINDNFTAKADKEKKDSASLSISENIDGGSKILLSDGSLYEIAKKDTAISAEWLLPHVIQVTHSSDKDYPFLLNNTQSGSTVKAKKIEIKQLP